MRVVLTGIPGTGMLAFKFDASELAGTLLWKASLGAQIVSGPITYEVDGRQYVTAISGLSLCVFALRE